MEISTLKFSSFIARNKEKNQPRLYSFPAVLILGKRLVLLIPMLVAGLLIVTGSERLRQINEQAQNQLIPKPLESIFTDARLTDSSQFSVITNVSPLIWVPKLKGHVYFDIMRGPYFQRLKSRVLTKKDDLLILKKLPDGGGFPQVADLESQGLITKLQENNIYALYRIE